MTIKDLKKYAELKGLTIEEYYPCSRIMNTEKHVHNITESCDRKYTIGLEFKKNVYYWFESYVMSDEMVSENDELFFDHRYNRNNGVVIKSIMQGIHASIYIMKYLKSNDLDQDCLKADLADIGQFTCESANLDIDKMTEDQFIAIGKLITTTKFKGNISKAYKKTLADAPGVFQKIESNQIQA